MIIAEKNYWKYMPQSWIGELVFLYEKSGFILEEIFQSEDGSAEGMKIKVSKDDLEFLIPVSTRIHTYTAGVEGANFVANNPLEKIMKYRTN